MPPRQLPHLRRGIIKLLRTACDLWCCLSAMLGEAGVGGGSIIASGTVVFLPRTLAGKRDASDQARA